MKFLTLAVSYKDGGLCVAGIDYNTMKFVRLGRAVSTGIECLPLRERDVKFPNWTLRIMDLIDVDVCKMPTNGCQVENYQLVNINGYIRKLSITEVSNLYIKMPHASHIFLNCDKRISNAQTAALSSSIGFFRINDLRVLVNKNEYGTPKYKSCFTYNNNYYNELSTTDSAICDYPHSLYGGYPVVDEKTPTKTLGDAFIMVTMPPKPWEKDNYFYKYVSGVIII